MLFVFNYDNILWDISGFQCWDVLNYVDVLVVFTYEVSFMDITITPASSASAEVFAALFLEPVIEETDCTMQPTWTSSGFDRDDN